MVKMLVLLRRKAGISHDECVKHHREVHAPLVASIWGAKMKKYVAHYVNEVMAGQRIQGTVTEPPFDMIVEQWWENEAWNTMRELRKTPEGKKISQDEKEFLDMENLVSFIVEENAIL